LGPNSARQVRHLFVSTIDSGSLCARPYQLTELLVGIRATL
jgi:hypothetical protein